MNVFPCLPAPRFGNAPAAANSHAPAGHGDAGGHAPSPLWSCGVHPLYFGAGPDRFIRHPAHQNFSGGFMPSQSGAR